MSKVAVRGRVSREGEEFPIAGVTVVADMPIGVVTATARQRKASKLRLGHAVTDSDGSFVLESNDEDPEVARWVCALIECDEFKLQVACFDRDETLLRETKPL